MRSETDTEENVLVVSLYLVNVKGLLSFFLPLVRVQEKKGNEIFEIYQNIYSICVH